MPVAHPAVLLALSLLVVAPAALASPFFPGPHAGVVREGELNSHHFVVFYGSQACRELAAQHTLTLVYAPPTDTLSLSVHGQTQLAEGVGQNGVAIVTFDSPPCGTWYRIHVAGIDVASVAAYDVPQLVTPSG